FIEFTRNRIQWLVVNHAIDKAHQSLVLLGFPFIMRLRFFDKIDPGRHPCAPVQLLSLQGMHELECERVFLSPAQRQHHSVRLIKLQDENDFLEWIVLVRRPDEQPVDNEIETNASANQTPE